MTRLQYGPVFRIGLGCGLLRNDILYISYLFCLNVKLNALGSSVFESVSFVFVVPFHDHTSVIRRYNARQLTMEKLEKPARNDADHVGISTSGVITLLGLPPELVLQIADFLPTTSTASFALCNKKFAAWLGRKSWKLLSEMDDKHRIHFLSILSRDLPRHHACHGCIRLHLSSSIPHPADFNAPRYPHSCIPKINGVSYAYEGVTYISRFDSLYKLRFPHIQLALKQHHHGLDHGISLGELSHTDIRFTGRHVSLFSVDARIASDELVMRSQEWVLWSQLPLENLLSGKLLYTLCPHLTNGRVFYDSLTTLLQCRLGHGAADNGCACMGLHRCRWCPMEYQIDVVDLKEQGTAICATKWTNFGAGRSARNRMPHNRQLGSIRSSYESQEEVSVDDLTAENKKRLSSSFFFRCIGHPVYLYPGGHNWKLAGCNLWYISPPEESSTGTPVRISSLLY